ncbi:hypothetical protein INT48_009349, partial [Thamnidium elegans]
FNNFDDEDDAFSGAFFGGLRPNLGGFVNPNRVFSETYRCFPIAMMQKGNERENVNYGGKIILPQSALEKLSQLNISYPMLFKLTNEKEKKQSHAGVLEFIAEEGRVYLPQWIQPQSTDFLDITDHRAVLEKALRNFATLTVGDMVQINYNDKIFEIQVLEVKPNYKEHSGISITETDLEVDFAPPIGYVEPTSNKPVAKSHMVIDAPKVESTGFAAFQGGGQSLRGKNKGKGNAVDNNNMDTEEGEDDGPLNLPFGQLYFGFPVIPPPASDEKDDEKPKHAFIGSGQTLRAKKK